MTNQEHLDKIIAEIPTETTRFIELSWDVAEILENYMETNKLKNKDLAKIMEVSPSVVSDWLTGMHNFTLKTIAKFEGRLGIAMVEELYKLHCDDFYTENEVFEFQQSIPISFPEILNNNPQTAADNEKIYSQELPTAA